MVPCKIDFAYVSQAEHGGPKHIRIYATSLQHESMPLGEATNGATGKRYIPAQVTMILAAGDDS